MMNRIVLDLECKQNIRSPMLIQKTLFAVSNLTLPLAWLLKVQYRSVVGHIILRH